MKYSYQQNSRGSDTTGRPTRRPMVEIEISHAGKSRKFLALLDSGADTVIISLSVAELLGLPYSPSRALYVQGVGSSILTSYITDVTLTVEHFREPVTVPAVLLDTEVPILLGQGCV